MSAPPARSCARLRPQAGFLARRVGGVCLALLPGAAAASALQPAGAEAHAIFPLTVWVSAAFTVIWLGVVALALWGARERATPLTPARARLFVVVGGVLFPTTVLTGLLGYGLWLMPQLRADAHDGMTVQVSGERFWWRFTYRLADGSSFETANELWLPVGRRSELLLESPDVIHSLWVPAWAGKMDAIPGRTNRLVVEPLEPGRWEGVCAELCGTAHAQMLFTAVAASADDFAAWTDRQNQGVTAPATPGKAAFDSAGCGACHAVRGTDADGGVGPDLTHLVSRERLAATRAPITRDSLLAFVSDPERFKPGAQMPAYADLPAGELDAIVDYLESLE